MENGAKAPGVTDHITGGMAAGAGLVAEHVADRSLWALKVLKSERDVRNNGNLIPPNRLSTEMAALGHEATDDHSGDATEAEAPLSQPSPGRMQVRTVKGRSLL